MRAFTFLATALIVSVCAVATVPAQVSTIPVGFNTATIPAAANATTPASTVISAPFYQVATFQGAISSVDSSNQISFSGASFGNLTSTPFLARFKTGNSTGRFYLITGNTATQLTLDISNADSTPDIAGYPLTTSAPSSTQTQVAVGNSVEICPANTLATLFAGIAFQTGASAQQADNVLLYNVKNQQWDTYYYTGTHWKQSGNLNPNLDNTVVLPDRGMLILRRGISSLTVTFLGTVPSTDEKTDFAGAGSSFRSTRFPVDMILRSTDPSVKNALNLQSLSGWLQASSAGSADNVLLWNYTSKNWDTYYYNGTHWKQSGNLNPNLDTQPVPLGSAIYVLRRSSASGTTATLPQTLPYTL
jgi:uncharacterized protein (TIGR02597 family)